MDLDLTGRTAFVSGSTQGIGHAVAAALVAEGMSVVVHGRDEGRVAGAVARLGATAPSPDVRVHGVAADVADPDGVARLLSELDAFGESGVDVPAHMVHYGVTKAALLALGNGLAKLTRGTAVTVNTVLGGPTWSDGVADAVEGLARQQGLDPAALRTARRATDLAARPVHRAR